MSLVTIAILVGTHIGAAVFGVLFGRRNVSKVNAALVVAQAELAKAKAEAAAAIAAVKAKV